MLLVDVSSAQSLTVTWIMKLNFNPELTLPLSLPPFSLTSWQV